MHQSQKQKPLKNTSRQWCDPQSSRVFYLKDTTYNVNERYQILPNKGIKH